jgi:hypothetical protein
MLLKITERCHMGCTHCLEEATPEGNDMSRKTLEDAMKFADNNGLLKFGMIISGGECSEHHDFENAVSYVVEFVKTHTYFLSVTIATNGVWMLNNPELVDRIINMGDKRHLVQIQVTNDKRFYPIKLEKHKHIFHHKNVEFCDSLDIIDNFGRAKKNNLECKLRKTPMCTNIRLLAKQMPNCTLGEIVDYMTDGKLVLPKICTPSIDVYGNIKPGESRLCCNVGTIYDKPEDIVNNIRNCECDYCTDTYEMAKILNEWKV